MKCLFFITIFFYLTNTYAQQVHLQGQVNDSQTGQPIAAATISIQSKDLFYPADNAGKFNIVSNTISEDDSVTFSCIGYQTKRLIAKCLSTFTTIKLTPTLTTLQEVKVKVNKPLLIKVGSKAKSDDLMSSTLPGYEIAMFMTGSKGAKGKIKNVAFYLGNGHMLTDNKGGDVTAKFRVKIYGVDSSGAPGVEITKDSIIVSAIKNDAWFDIDISQYNIENPDSGFFVAFCLLSPGHYEIKNGTAKFDDITALGSYNVVSPRLGTTFHEFKETCSFTGENTYFGWEWHKNLFNHSYMIRAVIASE